MYDGSSIKEEKDMDFTCTKFTTDGPATIFTMKDATFDKLRKEIGCQWADYVRLDNGQAIMVDDEGLLLKKPINAALSAIAGRTLVGDGLIVDLDEVDKLPYE